MSYERPGVSSIVLVSVTDEFEKLNSLVPAQLVAEASFGHIHNLTIYPTCEPHVGQP